MGARPSEGACVGRPREGGGEGGRRMHQAGAAVEAAAAAAAPANASLTRSPLASSWGFLSPGAAPKASVSGRGLRSED